MTDRMKLPPERDFGFYQRRKHDKWREVAPPEQSLEGPVADTHAHVHTLPEPAWELVRCAANGVRFVCEVCDPSEDALAIPDDVRAWQSEAREQMASMSLKLASSVDTLRLPEVRITAGVHPHNAKLYSDEIEKLLMQWLSAPETIVLGEIGLDYHYDLSPRDTQREVFRRQIHIAKELDMPIALHLRGGEDPEADNAHREAFAILQEEGFPSRGTILHCCALPPDELQPWIEADCYVAYGGALTFKSSDDAREGARIVPVDRLLLETDSPYMAPEPMRVAACTPAHVIFTAGRLAEVRGIVPGPDRERFLAQLMENTCRFFSLDN